MSDVPDPFREARQKSGVLKCPFHGEEVAMILRHEDVRKAAKDWQTFSSGCAVPCAHPVRGNGANDAAVAH